MKKKDIATTRVLGVPLKADKETVKSFDRACDELNEACARLRGMFVQHVLLDWRFWAAYFIIGFLIAWVLGI
jgi:hypothetical protein